MSLSQATTILATFVTEQIELDFKRNIEVNEGELTQLEADLEAEEWEKVCTAVLCSVLCCIVLYCILVGCMALHSVLYSDRVVTCKSQ